MRSVASVPGGEYVLVFLSRLRVVVFPFCRLWSVSSDSTAVRGVSERSVSANELASVSPGLPSGSKPGVLDISAAAAADELRPRGFDATTCDLGRASRCAEMYCASYLGNSRLHRKRHSSNFTLSS